MRNIVEKIEASLIEQGYQVIGRQYENASRGPKPLDPDYTILLSFTTLGAPGNREKIIAGYEGTDPLTGRPCVAMLQYTNLTFGKMSGTQPHGDFSFAIFLKEREFA